MEAMIDNLSLAEDRVSGTRRLDYLCWYEIKLIFAQKSTLICFDRPRLIYVKK
jgi:hypothetical protein